MKWKEMAELRRHLRANAKVVEVIRSKGGLTFNVLEDGRPRTHRITRRALLSDVRRTR